MTTIPIAPWLQEGATEDVEEGGIGGVVKRDWLKMIVLALLVGVSVFKVLLLIQQHYERKGMLEELRRYQNTRIAPNPKARR
jgi:hypothetical protein